MDIDSSLDSLLASPDEPDRKRAVILMAKRRSAADVARIQSLAEKDPSVDVRFFARRVLGFVNLRYRLTTAIGSGSRSTKAKQLRRVNARVHSETAGFSVKTDAATVGGTVTTR